MEPKATYKAGSAPGGPTEGPWITVRVGRRNYQILTLDRHRPLACVYDFRSAGRENARLMAAAPELLQALEAMLNAWFEPNGCPEAMDDAAELARAAVKKARDGVQN